jgi:hypothetical protein
MTENNGDEALDPASMLALAQKQQKSLSSQRGSFVPIIMAAYGVALLVGFIVLWSIVRLGTPSGIGVGVFIGLIAAASVLSAVLGIRGSRGIRSNSASAFTGTAYGISWSLAMAGLGVLGGGLIVQGMDGHLLLLFYSSLYAFLIGFQFFVAGAIWRAVPSLVVGGWLVLIAAVSPYLGFPNSYLLLGIGGGGAFIVLSIVTAQRARRARLVVATRG